jgi:hypothetical protein
VQYFTLLYTHFCLDFLKLSSSSAVNQIDAAAHLVSGFAAIEKERANTNPRLASFVEYYLSHRSTQNFICAREETVHYINTKSRSSWGVDMSAPLASTPHTEEQQ